jgi:hypothetical protein
LAELKTQIALKIKGGNSVNQWNAVAAVAFTTDTTIKAMVEERVLTAAQAILRTEASLGLSRISPGMMGFRQSHIGMIDAPVTQANRVDRFNVASIPRALICVGNLAGQHNFHRIEVGPNNVALTLPHIGKPDTVVSITMDRAGYWIGNRNSAIVIRSPQGVGSVIDQNTSNNPDALGGDIILVGNFAGFDRAAIIAELRSMPLEAGVQTISKRIGSTVLAYKLP